MTDAPPAPPAAPASAGGPRRAAMTSAEREAMLQAVVHLCEGAPTVRRPLVQERLGVIFLRLVADAEHDIRRRLAGRLAEADWAPPALVRALSLDDVDIARPLIAASPVLGDADLLAVLARATLEHRIAVAERPALSPTVVDAVIAGDEPAVLTALAANDGVVLHPDAMGRLVAAAQRVASLRGPLARRPELSAELARGLYAWVGETLRQALEARFALAAEDWRDAASAATGDAYAGATPSTPPPPVGEDGDETETRLIAKLEASGQLKPGYLLRTLREGRLSLFTAGLAALAGLPPAQVRRALAAPEPDLLALACVMVGLDRSAFPTLLSLVRSLNGDLPGEAEGSALAVARAFAQDRPGAAKAFHDAMRGAEA